MLILPDNCSLFPFHSWGSRRLGRGKVGFADSVLPLLPGFWWFCVSGECGASLGVHSQFLVLKNVTEVWKSWLDSMIFKVFRNLGNCMILWHIKTPHSVLIVLSSESTDSLSCKQHLVRKSSNSIGEKYAASFYWLHVTKKMVVCIAFNCFLMDCLLLAWTGPLEKCHVSSHSGPRFNYFSNCLNI